VATSRKAFSFSRNFRLTKPAEFAHVFGKAQRLSDRCFTVLYRENELDTARLGFAVAKRRIPAAVGRNRIRRIARESFRKYRTKLGSFDIIILAQSAAATATNSVLVASLEWHWGCMNGDDAMHRRGLHRARQPNKDKQH
jgi:ribonuclease P protein component